MNSMELFYRHLVVARLNGNEIQCCMAHVVIDVAIYRDA